MVIFSPAGRGRAYLLLSSIMKYDFSKYIYCSKWSFYRPCSEVLGVNKIRNTSWCSLSDKYTSTLSLISHLTYILLHLILEVFLIMVGQGCRMGGRVNITSPTLYHDSPDLPDPSSSPLVLRYAAGTGPARQSHPQ